MPSSAPKEQHRHKKIKGKTNDSWEKQNLTCLHSQLTNPEYPQKIRHVLQHCPEIISIKLFRQSKEVEIICSAGANIKAISERAKRYKLIIDPAQKAETHQPFEEAV
jgi:hypothetical protein